MKEKDNPESGVYQLRATIRTSELMTGARSGRKRNKLKLFIQKPDGETIERNGQIGRNKYSFSSVA